VNDVRIDNLRVLIVNGNLAVGRGLKALIEEIPGLCVVGLATRGDRGLKQAALTAPDVALVDADLPGLCSAAVIKLLRWRLPRVRVIALSIYPERQWAALAVGAHAFVLKDAGYDALRVAIAGHDEDNAEAVVGQPAGVARGADARFAMHAEERMLS
jgi:DNA-binding NarL/FixJ family response regulator